MVGLEKRIEYRWEVMLGRVKTEIRGDIDQRGGKKKKRVEEYMVWRLLT